LSKDENAMSVSAKAANVPMSCSNSACGKALCGQVNHCPYCGVAQQRVASAAKVAVLSVAPPPAAAAPIAARRPAHEPPLAPAAAAPEPDDVAVVAAVAAPVPAKPRKLGRNIVLGLVALGVFGLYQVGSRVNQEKLEKTLQAGKDCLRQNNFGCAIDNAEQVLQKVDKEPRALSLKQQAQSAQSRAQQAEADKQARLKAKAEVDAIRQQAAADKAAAEKARLAQEAQVAQAAREEEARAEQQRAQEQAVRNLQDRTPELKTRDTLQRAQEIINEQARRSPVIEPVQRPRPAVVQRPVNSAQLAGMLGQSIDDARRALAQRDFQTAMMYAGKALSADPGNIQAQGVMRQAQELQMQTLRQTRGQ
jgi:hypothetical protein